MIQPETATSSHSSYTGIFFYCSAVFLFVVMDSFVKHVTTVFEPVQIVWARYFFHMLLMVMILAPRHGMTLVKTTKPKLQIFRSLLLLGATICFFTALKFVPLADAGSVGASSPLFVVLLSVLVLKEKVGIRRWGAVVFGFIGALIVLRPGFDAVHPALFLVVGTSFFFALYQITTRLLAGVDDQVTTLFYTSLVGTVGTTIVVPFFWTAPDLAGWGYLILIGFIGGVSHFILIKAFHFATAATLAPFNYSQLVWTVIFGYFAFGDFPDTYTILGATFIVSSGLYILYRERQTGRA
jgi:drug/metabolite transporter (DMT)-like permease